MKLTEGTRSALRAHVWHTDRAPDEQRAFRSRVTAVTRQFLGAGSIAAVPLAILTWPLDYFAFRDRGPVLVWHITEWRLIVIAWCLGMLVGMRLLPQRTFAVIIAVSCVALFLLGASVGKVGPLHTNFFYTFYLMPFISTVVMVPVVQRIAVTFGLPVASVTGYLLVDPDFLTYPYLSTAFAVLALGSAMAIFIGHLFYNFVRISYFRGRDLQQEREKSERLLQRLVEHTNAELQRQIAERSRELSNALVKLQQPQQPIGEGRVIDGRYRVVRRLGAGGMATVHEVERISDGRHFALKTLRGSVDPESMARFAREAQIAAELHHPNLVPVIDLGVTDGGLFLIMELIDGKSLEQERKQFGDREWALPLLAQIAEGLAAIHERGIVHRDLKPANILLADGTARIADFGLASLRNESFDATEQSIDPFLDSTQLQLTQPGSIFGTASYMAPELAAGAERAESASDVFSFGVIAYEMLVGSPPFAEPPMLTRAHGRTIVPPAVQGLPPLLRKCLDVDPARRPAAAQLARTLADE